MHNFTVIKRDHNGHTKLTYTGHVIERGIDWVCIQAPFSRDMALGYITLNKGDLFTEWFYRDAWYNVFRIQDVHTGLLKGWYCNFCRPTELTEVETAADDLALDLFVYPNGHTLFLDEDEYHAIALTEAERQSVQAAITHLQHLIHTRQTPFTEVTP